MNKKLLTKVNNEVKQYDIILEFTSKETNKNYIIYTDNKKDINNNIIIYCGTYIIEDELYVIRTIETEEEIEMCNNILKDLK